METSTSIYEHAAFMFPNSDDSNRMVLRDILLSLEKAARPSVTFQYYVSIFGAALTVFHFFILTRKSLMTSSVMSIMIGVAVCDFVTMITTIGSDAMWFDEQGTDCSPPFSYLSMKVFWVLVSVRDLVRRASTWLGVLMALIRLLVVRFGARPRIVRFSEPYFGFHAVSMSFLVSLVFSLAYYFRYDFVEEGTWNPMKFCTDISLTTDVPIVVQKLSALFTAYNGLFGKTFMFANGICSKIVPCLLLPSLTFLLILELRRADKVRKTSNFMKRHKSERTTGLVIFMTVSFFVVELPVGIALVFQVAYTDLGFLYLATYVSHICNAVFTVSATIHCPICFLMSSQYRLAVAKIFRIEAIQQGTISSAQMSKIGN